MMMKAVIYLALWVALSVSAQSTTQVPNQTETESNAPGSTEIDPQDSALPQKSSEPRGTKGNAKPDRQVFKPSEEISEDLPVAFPVDI